MSVIYQPPGQPFNPLFQDCLDNAISRQSPNLTTNSLTLATLYTCLIPGKTLNTDGQRFFYTIVGNLSGTLGTKRIVALLDATNIFDSTALAINNNNYSLLIYGARLLTSNLHMVANFMTNAFGAPTVVTNQQLVNQINNIDLTQDHTLTIQGAVGNAGDNVSVIVASGSVL